MAVKIDISNEFESYLYVDSIKKIKTKNSEYLLAVIDLQYNKEIVITEENIAIDRVIKHIALDLNGMEKPSFE